jgi:hypothetical protein
MSRESDLKSIESVNSFLEETSVLWNQNDHKPFPDSQAEKELTKFPRPESIGTALSQGATLIEVAADHAFSLAKTLTEPAATISPWTCTRGALETSALSMWILDTKIDAIERVKRSLALRYEGLDQQRKFAQSTKGKFVPDVISKRIDAVEEVALSLGYQKVRDKKGKQSGIGQGMPSITDLVTKMLDKEQSYRLLSAMTHAHSWAVQQFGFIKIEADQSIYGNIKGAYFEKHLSSSSIFFLCTETVGSLFSALLMTFNMFGWDAKPLANIADRAIKNIRED